MRLSRRWWVGVVALLAMAAASVVPLQAQTNSFPNCSNRCYSIMGTSVGPTATGVHAVINQADMSPIQTGTYPHDWFTGAALWLLAPSGHAFVEMGINAGYYHEVSAPAYFVYFANARANGVFSMRALHYTGPNNGLRRFQMSRSSEVDRFNIILDNRRVGTSANLGFWGSRRYQTGGEFRTINAGAYARTFTHRDIRYIDVNGRSVPWTPINTYGMGAVVSRGFNGVSYSQGRWDWNRQ